ncbi:MAG TPA: PCRF domain-containing protein, partial [Draconibacterium sp.]|nr:PCRF domain-containing protein [Draconibacterium sp.]
MFDYDAKLIQLQEEELKTQDPDFWNNPKEAEAQMKKIRNIKVWTDDFNEVNQQVEDFQVLYEFFEADEASEEETDKAFAVALKKVEELEAKNMLRSE